jgi:hypothetical protein
VTLWLYVGTEGTTSNMGVGMEIEEHDKRDLLADLEGVSHLNREWMVFIVDKGLIWKGRRKEMLGKVNVETTERWGCIEKLHAFVVEPYYSILYYRFGSGKPILLHIAQLK